MCLSQSLKHLDLTVEMFKFICKGINGTNRSGRKMFFLWSSLLVSFILSANTRVAASASPFWCRHAALPCSLLLRSSLGDSWTEGSDSRCGNQVHAEPKRSQGTGLRPSQSPQTPDSLLTVFGVSNSLWLFVDVLLTVGQIWNKKFNQCKVNIKPQGTVNRRDSFSSTDQQTSW